MGLLDIFRRKQKEEFYTVLMTFFGKSPVWTEKDIYKLTKVGFINCMTVYACISLISRSVAGIPWLLYQKPKIRDGKLEEIIEHPLLNLLARPNDFQGQGMFFEEITAFYFISGNSYIYRAGPEGKPPQKLWSLKPHRVKVISGNTTFLIGGYEYRVEGQEPVKYGPEEILHIKTFHPLNDYYGLSPLQIAAKGIDISNMAENWNLKLLENDMRPPGAIKFEKPLTPEQRKQFRKYLREIYLGHEHAGMPLILEGATDWKQFAITPKDADWLNSDKLNTRKICSVLNVPPELIGDSENKTYSNYKEARKAFYMETILPFMDRLRDELNNWLTPLYGDFLFLDYDRDKIEALREEMNAVYERMSRAWWLTVNERREVCGYEEVEGGDEIYIPINLIPLGVSFPGEKAEEEKVISFWQKKERKKAFWIHFIKRVEMKERKIKNQLEKYFRKQADEIKEKISNYISISINAHEVFNIYEETDKFHREFKQIYFDIFESAGEAGLRATKGELIELTEEIKQEGEFRITENLETQLEELIMNSGAQINQTTLKKIQELITKGINENWTVEDLTQKIHEKLNELAITRARTIARTETAKVENWGQLEGYKQSEFVERKGWLCAFVETSRDAHMRADFKYSSEPIPIDEPFLVDGEELQYPGDPNGSPGNVVNCLCTTFPEIRQI